ncbi:MAG TPA: GDSL-type esterase/lipase family protein [Bryobacteraceae bacterium]
MTFPFRTAFGIAVVIGLVSAAHFVLPAAKLPGPELFTSLVEFTPEVTPEAPLVRHVNRPEESPVPVLKPGHLLLEDSSGALNSFYNALWRVERRQQPDVARIVHYGDSPTTADLITGDVRMLLQKRFGDVGPGFTLIAKPWAWYQHHGVQISGSGWQIDAASHFVAHDGLFGLGGVSFSGNAGAHDQIKYSDPGPLDFEIWYLAQPGGGRINVIADGNSIGQVETGADTQSPGFATLHATSPVGELQINVESGNVRLFGVEASRPGPGLLYDSLGMNGASITVMTRMFNREFWTEELRHHEPCMVIINYGTNEADFASYVNGPYEKDLREAVRRVQGAVPEASVMLMSPMDRGKHVGLDEIETMPTIPQIVAIQKRVAADMGCAFFNTFEAMGGDGTMARWYQGERRLVSADLIHPIPAGGRIVANAFVKELMLGYNRFKLRQLTKSKPEQGNLK